MNLPNKLTLGRFGLTVAFLIVFFARWPFADTIALAIFIAATVSDYWDGELARRHNLITNFGILMDPLADKILVCSAFIAFVGRGIMPAWMVVLVVARELAITGLRMLAASKQKILAAERYGKHKTITQAAAIIAVLLGSSFAEWGAWTKPILAFWLPFAQFTIWVALILTAYSGAMYLWRNRAIYLDDM